MGITSAARGLALLAFCGLSSIQAIAAKPAEQLDYQVVYRGVFSLGKDMPIADLALQTLTHPGTPGLRETRLEATSAAYSTVESLYPIRYRFRTWAGAQGGKLVGFETYENTRKLRHRLYLRDDSELGVRLFDLATGKGRAEMALLDTGENPVTGSADQLLFDRLGLLQRVRGQELREDAEYRFPVTNGRDPFIYRIRVESAQQLEIAGTAYPAWKLRFDGAEVMPDGSEEPSHRPVYVWVSRTPEHIPLRIDSRHPIGLFRIELHPAVHPEQLARLDH